MPPPWRTSRAYALSWRLGCDVLHVEPDQHGRQIAMIELHARASDPSGNGVFKVSVVQLGDMSAASSSGPEDSTIGIMVRRSAVR